TSPVVETKNPTVSEIPNSATTPTETKTETSPVIETKNPTVSEIPNSDPNPAEANVINSIDFITGNKIETPVFIQPDKPEIPASTTSTDILTGEIENTYPTLIDNAETASSQNHQPSASEYIVTDTQTIPEISVTENHHSQQSENIIPDSDNQPPTTIDKYLNPDFDSENITITPAIPSDENQPENSPNIITDSNTNINEYTITNTETQPLIGIIDTGFIADNPNIDYSQIILGKDVIDNDNNPLIQPNQGNQHGETILEIISTPNNQNNPKKAPTIWLARATGSSNWHQSLIEFVDTAKESSQPNAVINLSFDLTGINPDGTETTRYQLTPEEKAALKYAQDNNILIVAAAGNEGTLVSALGQASTEFNNIITVGAAENNNRSAYSSYGEGLDILALDTIGSTTETTTEPKQGTSIAAAIITKTISQMWETNPSLNPQQIKNILLETATDIDVPGWDERTGYGILNQELAIATAAQTIPAIPVLAATKQLIKPLISADQNISQATAKPSSRAALTNGTTNTPKTTTTSTGDYNIGTSSTTTELAPNTTSNTSKSGSTTSTNTQTNRSYSHTNSNWNKSRTNTNSNGNSFYETKTDTNTNTNDYTDKNLSLYSIERTDKSQSSENRLKYEGTVNSQGSSKEKWSSNRNYTSPSQTQKSAEDSYLNRQTQSDGKHDGNYGESNSKTQEDSGSKSTTNNQYTSSNGSSGDNTTTQRKGKINWTSSSKGNNSNSTYSGDNSEVTQSNSHSKTSSDSYKTNNSSDNRSITNNTWDNTTTNGKTVGSSTRDTYSEANNNYNTSYDDGKSKNKSNTDTYTQNQSQETNSSNGTNSWRNNRDNNYSITSVNNTDTYKNGGDSRNHNRDYYSINKSNSSSSNSSGKPSSKNESENYSENQEQWDNEYKADTYTTKSNINESTITASKSNSSTEGNNTNSSNSSDTSKTSNSQTVTTYKDGRKTEDGSSTYEKWLRDSSYDSKGLVSDVYKYSSWTSSYTKSYFKGGYSWTETISGSDSESTTKRAVYTSSSSSWSWTRSGTVWDDGRNDWSESWWKWSWKDGKYLPSESDSKRGGFDPKKTTPQVNDVPKFGEAPRLTKAPKRQVPPELNKPPKPSKDILLIPTVIIKDAASKNTSGDKTFWLPTDIYKELKSEKVINGDGYFNASSPNNRPNKNPLQKLLKFINRLWQKIRQGGKAVLDFVGALLYYYLKNNLAFLHPFTDPLFPKGVEARAKLEKLLQRSKAAQAGRGAADVIGILQGIAEILFGGGGSIGGGLSGNLVLAEAGLALAAHGLISVQVNSKDLENLITQVLQSNSGHNPWDDVSDEDLEEFLGESNPAYEYLNTRSWHPGGSATPEISVKQHFKNHGAEVGAKNMEEYIQLAEQFKQVVLNDRRIQGRPISGATPNVSRYESGGKYIDLVDLGQGRYGIISFGKVWHR
ncbi:S8/S53 family peptidase, partial [Microcoleus sp. herbarium12]|uniref:S8/S53 family peptidase n=1 Tax=Microcoleus sp. herbarium12 TaxID=3055437 RepID=UPI002FD08B00